jgi:magnesium transporter
MDKDFIPKTGKMITHQTKKQLHRVKKILKPIQKPKSKKVGLSPGTLVYTGEKKKDEVKITLFDYKEDSITEKELNSIEESFSCKNSELTSWINIDGLHDLSIIEKIGKQFEIHPLVLEDIVHTSQRPKVDDYENYLYIVVRMFDYNTESKEIKNEQVSFVLGKKYLITFQEDTGDVFDTVRDRLRKGGPRMRNGGSDYLAYALIDAIVDSYFHILEQIGDVIEELEDRIIVDPEQSDLQSIHSLRREMILLRKSVWPLRELLSSLQRNENGIIKHQTQIYIRDVYDHTIQIIDTIESYRDMAMGMLETYLSSLSNRMNEVMKVLTVIATIFIPLTFLAGVYGMNFTHFPELQIEWMYPWGFWGFIIICGGLMYFYFKHKKWF